tara:strand:+ start:101 stop:325 length:225 start_codon:yes stop_codon:yes gene_type:complete
MIKNTRLIVRMKRILEDKDELSTSDMREILFDEMGTKCPSKITVGTVLSKYFTKVNDVKKNRIWRNKDVMDREV